MEHTHLVKGLDFALLSKVKQENQQKEKEEKQKAQEDLEAEQAQKQKYVTFIIICFLHI
jgi:RED-like protein N-terminal region